MTERLREQLLGYLLGALEPEEVAEIEQILSMQPAARAELEQLRSMLEPLEAAGEPCETPSGLAFRTCGLVDYHARRQDQPPADVMSPVQPRSSSSTNWSAVDLVMATGICLAFALLFLPAIVASRDTARNNICRDQLVRLGLALEAYHELHRQLPPIPPSGPGSFAGYIPSQLVSCGVLTDPTILVCPESPLAENLARWPGVATVAEISSWRDAELLDQRRRTNAGSQAFYLGYVENGRYELPSGADRPWFALIGDGSWAAAGRGRGHGRGNRNILFENNTVRSYPVTKLSQLPDDPYLNRDGQLAPGLNHHDAVLGDSAVRPFARLPLPLGRP